MVGYDEEQPRVKYRIVMPKQPKFPLWKELLIPHVCNRARQEWLRELKRKKAEAKQLASVTWFPLHQYTPVWKFFSHRDPFAPPDKALMIKATIWDIPNYEITFRVTEATWEPQDDEPAAARFDGVESSPDQVCQYIFLAAPRINRHPPEWPPVIKGTLIP